MDLTQNSVANSFFDFFSLDWYLDVLKMYHLKKKDCHPYLLLTQAKLNYVIEYIEHKRNRIFDMSPKDFLLTLQLSELLNKYF